MATISTHNGSQVRRAHNVRDPHVVRKEAHINPEGPHEIWIDNDIKEIYEKVFGNAVAEYNACQSRRDRRIDDYLQHVTRDKRLHVAYEMIVGIYPDSDSTEEKDIISQKGYDILKKYIEGWRKANPNLILLGVYYHGDEQGRAPHLHVDYVPRATYEHGLGCRATLSKALEQQGDCGISHKRTAQMAFQARENSRLEDICREYGIRVRHPQRGKGTHHLQTEAYKASQEAQRASRELKELKKVLEDAAIWAYDHGYMDKASDVIQQIEKIERSSLER